MEEKPLPQASPRSGHIPSSLGSHFPTVRAGAPQGVSPAILRLEGQTQTEGLVPAVWVPWPLDVCVCGHPAPHALTLQGTGADRALEVITYLPC